MSFRIHISACCGTCKFYEASGFISMFGNGAPKCKNKHNLIKNILQKKKQYLFVDSRLVCPHYKPDRNIKKSLLQIVSEIQPPTPTPTPEEET